VKKNNKAANFTHIIRIFYPSLEICSVQLNEEGQYNDILILNEELIFRFPRYAPAIQALRDEAAILCLVRKHVSLPVPDPEFLIVEPPEPGKVFMGYRLIPGEPFWRELQNSILDEKVVCRIAHQLATFLLELHRIPPELIEIALPLHDTLPYWQAMFAEIRSLLFPFMCPEARFQVTQIFELFFADSNLHTFKPCLRHGDFGTGNFLFDPHTQSICGIIDFGFAGLGDPATDIAAASCMGERFFLKILEVYPQSDLTLQRAHFYRSTFALQEALHGCKNGDQAAFESGIAAYK
jgi:aminoglycoside 2''-phosphotransferase